MSRTRTLSLGAAIAVCVAITFATGFLLGSKHELAEDRTRAHDWAETRAAGWVLGEGAQLNGVALDRVHVGFGDRLSWPFGTGPEIISNVSSVDLIVGGPKLERAARRAGMPLEALRLEHGLQHAKFVVLWVTPQWQPAWFASAVVQRLLDHGLTPVFIDWYFGDRLLGGDAMSLMQGELLNYAEHSRRLGRFLGQFDGDLLIVMEPELNKPEIETWPEFGLLLRKHGIARIRAGASETNAATGRKTTLFFGTALTDNGLRDVNQPDDVYGTKSRGDSYGWTLSRPLLEALRPDLDFVGFQQFISQFHRDPENPERAVAVDPDAIGLAHVPVRILNYSRYLREQLGLPILIPYLGFPTSTWHDRNGDQMVQPSEVSRDGWEKEIGGIYAELRAHFTDLHDAGVFGIAPMMLLDDPVHDLGGYQYLLQNEYSLGLIATNARDGQPGETFGLKLKFKQLRSVSYVQMLFQQERRAAASTL